MTLSTDDQRLLHELAYESILHGLETGKPLACDLAQFPAQLQ